MTSHMRQQQQQQQSQPQSQPAPKQKPKEQPTNPSADIAASYAPLTSSFSASSSSFMSAVVSSSISSAMQSEARIFINNMGTKNLSMYAAIPSQTLGGQTVNPATLLYSSIIGLDGKANTPDQFNMQPLAFAVPSHKSR